jgi:2,3-bisphosphoglycerate-independent phosphoglycerate mutase
MTGYLDTNYKGKAEAALDSLKKTDFVYIHVESPDEAGHSGRCEDKIKAIEDFDRLVVGTVMDGIAGLGGCRLLLLPDHPTPIELRTHTGDPVPFVLFDSREVREKRGAKFDEEITKMPDALSFDDGYTLMDFFIKGK